MIPVTVMVAGRGTVSERIKGRYGRGRPSKFTDVLRPIAFWNMTYQCNLRCKHCYIRALAEEKPGELNTEEAKNLLRQLNEIGSPLVLMSGGEPLERRDFWEIAEFGSKLGRPKLALSTNGTLITRDVAERLRELGFVYVGVSIDSLEPERHDEFRGVKGSWEAAVRGAKASVEAGLPTGVRLTVTRWNVEEAVKIVPWAADLGLERVSLYILDTVGRGEEIAEDLPTKEQLKHLVDELVEVARRYAGRVEVQLVRANFLGIYLADKLASSREEFLEYLEMLDAQGDCGRKTVSIYPAGDVHPCQFLDWVTIGNVREKPLSEILKPDNPKLKPYLEIHKHLRGPKCSTCPFRRICGGGSRGRARALTGDEWGDDPLCIIDDPRGLARRWGLDPDAVL